MRILTLEDDIQLSMGINELLTGCGYEAESARDIFEAKAARKKNLEAGTPFELYLLDIMLQKGSGFSFCREIRESEDTPIIFLTALDDEENVVQGLNLGGDDYITKPFRSKELLARISAHLRRYQKEKDMINGREAKRPCLESGELLIAPEEGKAYLRGSELSLRKIEMELLLYFMESDGRLLRREQILERIWDSMGNVVEDNTLSVHISRLRKKIGKYQGEDYIETVRGVGYRWKVWEVWRK